jgi:hypothetical protein
MIISSANVKYYIVAAIVVISVSYFLNKWKQTFEDANGSQEKELIQKYLLNDTPLYGETKPKLWIHTTYDINARKWRDFYSRNTTDLNQPYIHLTIRTIINHCGDDFNVCLIDDDTFSKLLPSWEIDLSKTPEPMKTRYRELGLLELLYVYGGMVLPNSFVCTNNLKELYDTNTENDKPFVCETINRSVNTLVEKQKMMFIPDTYIMGSHKNNETIFDLITFLKHKYNSVHFTSENEFIGLTNYWCIKAIRNEKMNLIGGEIVGIKTKKRKRILIENLIEEDYLDLHRNAVGIYIPIQEILQRPKYQWFAVLPSDQLLNSNMIISKYIVASLVDTTSEYKKTTKVKSKIAEI